MRLLLCLAIVVISLGPAFGLPKEVETAIRRTVTALNAEAPIRRGDWMFTRASYNARTGTVTYAVKDMKADISTTPAAGYAAYYNSALKGDVCGKTRTFIKYGVNVIYVISDRRGRFITKSLIRTSTC